VDLDERWFLRVPGAGPNADGQVVAVNTLPHDRRPLPLLHVVRCELGERMWLIGEPHPDGSVGRRASTIVLDIRLTGGATHTTGQRRTPGNSGGLE
jgi:hypothetical protein